MSIDVMSKTTVCQIVTCRHNQYINLVYIIKIVCTLYMVYYLSIYDLIDKGNGICEYDCYLY